MKNTETQSPFVGTELKEGYFKNAVSYLKRAEAEQQKVI
jgi:hypothetical protein